MNLITLKEGGYAPDVGLIIERDYTENWNTVEISQELVSFSINRNQGAMPSIPLLLLEDQ
jgi:hypothetical protein